MPASSTVTPLTPARRPRRRQLARWTKRIALALAAVGAVGAIAYAWIPTPALVDVGRAQRAPLDVEVVEDGQTRVRDRYVVAAPVSGELERIELEPGAPVTATTVLARIMPAPPLLLDARSRREAQARVELASARQAAAMAGIAKAKLAHAAAARDAERDRRLEAGGAIAAAQRERGELAAALAARDLVAAQQERAAAQAELAAARAVLAEPPRPAAPRPVLVAAPAAGTVLRVVRDSAGPVAAGAPLLELGDPRQIEVVVDVLSSDAAQIQPGMQMHVEDWGGAALTGRVDRIEPSAFTRISALGVEEQRVRVIASLAHVPATLGDGFRVTARIITWHGDGVLVIPASALFRARGGWAVYIADGGRARLRPVERGHHGRYDVEITSGLAAGEHVLLHPGDTVSDGARIAIRR